MSLEKYIKQEIERLEDILNKYHELNKKTNNKFDWRVNAIIDEIETLENALNENSSYDEWIACYEEDKRDA